jgi:hypothetical protein
MPYSSAISLAIRTVFLLISSNALSMSISFYFFFMGIIGTCLKNVGTCASKIRLKLLDSFRMFYNRFRGKRTCAYLTSPFQLKYDPPVTYDNAFFDAF